MLLGAFGPVIRSYSVPPRRTDGAETDEKGIRTSIDELIIDLVDLNAVRVRCIKHSKRVESGESNLPRTLSRSVVNQRE